MWIVRTSETKARFREEPANEDLLLQMTTALWNASIPW
jgi:hypothetical protein